jgi:hypothetical protein
MNKIINKFSNLSNYYTILYELTASIGNIKLSYIVLFFITMFFSAFFEISILGFLFILIKAFMDPSYYQGNFFFGFFLEIFNINTNRELLSYLRKATCSPSGEIFAE